MSAPFAIYLGGPSVFVQSMLFAMLMNSKGRMWMEESREIISNPYFNTRIFLFNFVFDAQLCYFIPTIHTVPLPSHILSKTITFLCNVFIYMHCYSTFFNNPKAHVSHKTVLFPGGLFSFFLARSKEANTMLLLIYCLVHLQMCTRQNSLNYSLNVQLKTLASDFLSHR